MVSEGSRAAELSEVSCCLLGSGGSVANERTAGHCSLYRMQILERG